MAKLTPTELKVLATEAQNRIVSAVNARNEEIKEQKEYINFERDFKQSVVGQQFVDLINSAMWVDKIMDDAKFKSGRSNDLENITKSKMEAYCRFLKNKAYPLLDVNTIKLPPQQSLGWKYEVTLYDHFLHELQLKQLTTNADLMKLLEEMVTDFIKKI